MQTWSATSMPQGRAGRAVCLSGTQQPGLLHKLGIFVELRASAPSRTPRLPDAARHANDGDVPLPDPHL